MTRDLNIFFFKSNLHPVLDLDILSPDFHSGVDQGSFLSVGQAWTSTHNVWELAKPTGLANNVLKTCKLAKPIRQQQKRADLPIVFGSYYRIGLWANNYV